MDQLQAEAIAARQMDPGERLLWSGRPAAGSAARRALPASLLGIPFTAFAAFWMWSAARVTPDGRGPWGLFPLFGIPFLLIGLGMLFAPLWAWFRATGTVYAVTGRRILVINGGGSGRITSYAREDIRDLARTEREDGSGSVFFGWRSSTTSRGFVRRSRLGLIGIPDTRNVERLIREHILERAA